MPRRLKQSLEREAGTATGIAAPISTTEHRSARFPTTNAASIPLRSPGPSSRGAAEPARAARAMAAVDKYLVRRDEKVVAAVHAALRQSGARSRLYQGLSARHSREWRAIYPCARSGRRWRSRCRAMATRRTSCCRCSIQSTTPTAAPEFIATRSSPMWSAPTSIRCRRMSGAADGLGTPARPDGCIAWRSNGFLDFACKATHLVLDPCIPRDWPGFRDRLPLSLLAL